MIPEFNLPQDNMIEQRHAIQDLPEVTAEELPEKIANRLAALGELDNERSNA